MSHSPSQRYLICEVNGSVFAGMIHSWNALNSVFPPLTDHHLETGYWWFVHGVDAEPVAFAGMVMFEPFPGVGYLKRAYVNPAHRGHGLQRILLAVREAKARDLGWTQLVSECAAGNVHSARNFAAAGFLSVEPEQRWGAPGSAYWSLLL